MWRRVADTAVAIGSMFVVACSQNVDDEEYKTTYSLCPKSEDSHIRVYEFLQNFADEQGANLIDRSSGAQQELSDLGSNILERTGRQPILVTIEKEGQYRVSFTNLGLREKAVLSVRTLHSPNSSSPSNSLLEGLSGFWFIEESKHNVTDEPPCP